MRNDTWQKPAETLYKEGKSYAEIEEILRDSLAAAYPGLDRMQLKEKVRTYIRRLQRNDKIEKNTPAPSVAPEDLPTEPYTSVDKSVSFKGGASTFESIIALPAGVTATPEIVMKAHNLDVTRWEVVAYRSNLWQAQTKLGTPLNLYQSKLTVKPTTKPFSTDEVDEFFKTVNPAIKRRSLKPFAYNTSEEILEIDYTDLHVGLLAWKKECGSDFDLNIIRDRFFESIADVVARCKGKRFKLIRFITLGDILHVDNSKQTTTNGTFQQIEGRVPKIFDLAVDMLTTALETLLKLKSPVEYVYIAGNHDRDSGYYLAKTVATYFKDEPNISCDIGPNPLKAKIYGRSLVGYCHGDMPNKNLGTWLIQNYRSEFGNTDYSEVHCGHLHSKSEDVQNGIKVIRLPALCESSYWEHQMGYKSERALCCYVWNEKTGKRETWITNF